MIEEYTGEKPSDDLTPNSIYAMNNAPAIRAHRARGMSRRTLENIYGASAVRIVLGDEPIN